VQSTHDKACSLLLALVLGCAVFPVFADEACVDFKWDVSKERALFSETPATVTAGKDPASAPVVVPSRLYRLRLATQDLVAFAVSPPNKAGSPSTSTYAGLAMLKVPAPGNYRVAVDLPLWIDVISNGTLTTPTDFQGQRSCSAPHKIVEFDLAGMQPFVLQFSNAVKDDVLVAVTPSPPRKH
jgi:hypothetical protein